MSRLYTTASILALLTSVAFADPNPPGNLTVTTVSPTQLDLSWVDTNTTEEGYIVDRATVATGPFQRIGTVPPNTTIYRDTGLSTGKRYFYNVYAAAQVLAISPPASGDGTTDNNQPPPNNPPVAVNDSFTGENGQVISGDVLANDSDPDGDTLQTDPQSGGIFSLNTEGEFTFNAPTNGDIFDFPYTVRDGKGGTDTATVHFSLTPVVPPQPGPGDSVAYVDPTDGAVPLPREVRADGKKLVFPSAKGYGRFAGPDLSPGHNTKIMKITTTADTGTGSFRACWTGTGARLCLPTVSGTIKYQSDMLIKDPNSGVYVAGQTSPGGLQVTPGTGATAGPFRSNRTNDIVIRFIKGRVGTEMQASSNGQGLSLGGQRDKVTGVWYGKDIMVDHVSTQWGTDENLSLVGVTNATVQWTNTTEPLACGSCRDDGATQHDFSGMFLVTNGDFTGHHNFLMNGTRRMPNVAGNSFDWINSITYNWKTDAGIGYVGNYPAQNSTIINFVGNWFGRGPRTINSQNSGAPAHCLTMMNEATPTTPGVGGAAYASGNICSHDFTGQNNSRVVWVKPGTTVAQGYSQIVNSQPVGKGLSMQPEDAETAAKEVLAWAGARADMFSSARADAVDTRSINQFLNCANRNYQPQPTAPLTAIPAPGFPDLTQGTTWAWTADSDNDGMIDDWELGRGTWANVPRKNPVTSLATLTINGDRDGDGWSDLEEFLAYFAGEGREIPKVATLPAKNCGYPAQ